MYVCIDSRNIELQAISGQATTENQPIWVGFFLPDGQFYLHQSFKSDEQSLAEAKVADLNGYTKTETKNAQSISYGSPWQQSSRSCTKRINEQVQKELDWLILHGIIPADNYSQDEASSLVYHALDFAKTSSEEDDEPSYLKGLKQHLKPFILLRELTSRPIDSSLDA